MEIKEYQQKTLNHLESFLNALKEESETKEFLRQKGRGDRYDVPAEAWKQVRPTGTYNSRKNGLAEDVPFICLKVPTGGGKTFLATKAIDLINRTYRQRRNGLVLWVVPTTQIYRQTLTSLRNREHYYRQALDIASGGRTLILEKTDRFTPAQLQDQLVLMLLMLPSANRLNKETLKMFQDSAGFESFFPAEDDGPANVALLEQFPNLDYFGDKSLWPGVTIKTSLGNVLRITKPLVIIDEGHKAYSETAQQTIRGFNPCFVLELSATPNESSNVLVSISGQELDREEMIKLDLNIEDKATNDWRVTLLAAHERRIALEDKAREYESQSGRYIRPICLIQVERTGRDQQNTRFIHANEVRSFLIEQCGVSPQNIAIKSSETDGLEDVDLLSRDCPICYIITKQALQEGWDCAFAYVLAVLTNPGSETGLTQLVGRILRQPHAKKTKVRELDESYVFCFQRRAGTLLDAVRRGFSEEGLGDLIHRARVRELGPSEMIEVSYRAEFTRFEGKIYLPRFVIQEEHGYRDLSYTMDIVRLIDWGKIDLSYFDSLSLGALAGSSEDRYSRVGFREDSTGLVDEVAVRSDEAVLGIDKVFMTAQISDIVPNPWIAYQIVSRTLSAFSSRYDEARIGADMVLILDELKKLLLAQRDILAEDIFRELISSGKLCFFLQAISDYVLPRTVRVRAHARKLTRDTGDPIQQSLFEYVPEEDFNETEKAVAVYLDEQAELLFWYRNLVGPSYYSIQGWRKHRIYPDFVTTRRDLSDSADFSHVYVLETKGLHLKGNADTAYKENIFALCNELGRTTDWESWSREFGRKPVEFQVIYEDEWKVRINELFS